MFLTKKMQNRDIDEPFQIVYEMCKNANSKGFRLLQKVINGTNPVDSLEEIATFIRNKLDATKFQTYCTELNPELGVHKAYGKYFYLRPYRLYKDVQSVPSIAMMIVITGLSSS